MVDVGAANMTVEGDSTLGPDLYRAHIEYSGPKPSVTFDQSTGGLRISQQDNFNPSGSWGININSGTATDVFNLSGVQVGFIEVTTGASRDEISVGPPNGIEPITINGGALTVHVHRPSGTEVSAQVSGAAISSTGNGDQAGGVGSKSWQSTGYAAGSNAYKIEVSGGACTVTVDTNASSG